MDEQGSCAYEAYARGVSLLRGGSAHAAAISLERARELEPDQGSIREALARAYYRAGRYSEASEEFTRAVELDPVNDYAHFGLGLCLAHAGDDIGARRHLKLAVAMRPEAPHYRRALGRVRSEPR